jgi:hypothetical protein
MNYGGEFLYPPRPEQKVAPQLLSFYERRGWIGQLKKNGTCTVIAARGDDVRFWTRHGEAHKQWTPKAEHIELFAGTPNWIVLVAELLHSKVPGIRDHLYLFDVLVLDGKPLVGVTLRDRLKLLGPDSQWWALQQRGQVSIAWTLDPGSNFRAAFESLTAPEDEGIVLKNPEAKLRLMTTATSNTDGQVKCRKPHKNFSF